MADAGEDARPGSVIRVGDAERRAVDDRLQRAHGEGRLTLVEYEERAATVWAARTQDDLDVVTSDLPPAGQTGREPATVGRKAVGRNAQDGNTADGNTADGNTADRNAADREAGTPSWARRAGGVLGTLVVAAAVLWGGGQVVSQDDGAVVFGARSIAVAPGDDRVELGVLFGAADVVVPDDARVVVGGTTVFGSVDCDAACLGTGPREITVDVSGAFAGIDILTEREVAAADAEDAAEEAAENAEDALEDAGR